ncbi:transposase [Enterococcus faecium]|uniref:transposase n=1 Tax=Enterococcus faecium TaxID=1352 RepID=UPI0009867B88|nr:hypothetical protein [Enterococcus faecium]OOG24491.1 hypothetical protein BZK37_14710 [Enterococcus casseliflavus]PQW01867.1 hypothetical protein CWC54_00160 [Enterococcus faecium]QKL18691.1 hypothetical protein CWC51_009155 [Enterococcus faecium]TEA57947.1 hypothetical protein CWC53_04140 [Enterococcus faecium]
MFLKNVRFFKTKLISKQKRDVVNIKEKIRSMYKRVVTQKDIISTVEIIYSHSISNRMILDTTDTALIELEDWQS